MHIVNQLQPRNMSFRTRRILAVRGICLLVMSVRCGHFARISRRAAGCAAQPGVAVLLVAQGFDWIEAGGAACGV